MAIRKAFVIAAIDVTVLKCFRYRNWDSFPVVNTLSGILNDTDKKETGLGCSSFSTSELVLFEIAWPEHTFIIVNSNARLTICVRGFGIHLQAICLLAFFYRDRTIEAVSFLFYQRLGMHCLFSVIFLHFRYVEV